MTTWAAFVGGAPLIALKKAAIAVDEVMAGSRDGALALLEADGVAAAAVSSRFLEHYPERETVAFRENDVADRYPDLAVIAHPRVRPIQGRIGL